MSNNQGMRKATTLLIVLLWGCLHLVAQEADSTSRHALFAVDYTGEVQTDFRQALQANLLQLHADVPLSKTLSFQVASISTFASREETLADDLQSYSNINAENIPFALSVAGLTWQVNERHSVFAGIRRTDEDYFCSDGLALFTNSSCGIFPTISSNFDIGVFPNAALGLHYAYEREDLHLQASLYNGVGHHHFTGSDNVFRFRPKTDGIFAMGQAEYRYRGSHYFVGASVHTRPSVQPTVWAYAEQALLPRLTLLAAYGHAFGRDIACRDFCGLGARYALARTEFGLFTDYTRVDGIDEWATELVCSFRLTDFLTLIPVVHILTTDGNTKCIGILRMELGI